MNRAARRAFAASQRGPTPASGRPADLFRQLAALGVTAKIARGYGTVRLDYLVRERRLHELRAVLAAFPSGAAWDHECLATLAVLTGEMFEQMPRGSDASVSLARLLADPVDSPLARELLMRGTRQ